MQSYFETLIYTQPQLVYGKLLLLLSVAEFINRMIENDNWTRTFVTLITQKCIENDTYFCTWAQSTLHEQRALRRSSSEDD